MPERLLPMGLWRRLGRRGLVLGLFGLAWAIQGLGLLSMGPMRAEQDIPHDHLPYPLLAVLWLVTGLLAIGFSLRKRRQSDTGGFLAVSFMPMLLAGSYLISFVTFALSGGERGWPQSILGFAIYAVIWLALAIVASWPEPTNGGRDE